MPNTPSPSNDSTPTSRRLLRNPEKARRESTRTIYPRKRAVTACQTCRGRKKKCDNVRPSCGFCLETGSLCNYVVSETAVYDSASLAILDRLSTIEKLLRSGEHSSPSTAQALPVTDNEVSAAPAESPLPSREFLNPVPSLDLDLPSLSRVRTDTVLRWPALQGALSSAKRQYFLDQDGNRNFTFLNNPALGTCGEVRTWAVPVKPFRFSIDRVDVERLVDQFFLYTHTKNPILDRNTIRQYCDDVYEQGVMWNLSTCAILLVCALGAVARRWEYQPTTLDKDSRASISRYEDLEVANSYYTAAEKRLGLTLKTPSSLSVQCLCLAGMFCMYTLDSSGALNMFHTAGTVLQTVISASESNTAESTQSKESLNIISRLYWTCFKSEREILAEFPIGHLALTHPELFKRYPSPPFRKNDESLKDQWAQREDDSWYYYLAEIALRRITDRIVEVLFTEVDPCDFYRSSYPIQQLIPATVEFERQLASWHESLPGSMAFPEPPILVDSELRYFLRSRYYLVSELLHRPFLCFAIHNPEVSSPKVLELAQKCLVFAFNYLIQSNHTHRHHGKWLQLRREVTTTCLLLAASGSGIEMPQGWQRGVERAQEHLRYWAMEALFIGSWEQTIMTVNDYFISFQVLHYDNNQSGEGDGSIQYGS